MSEGKFNIEFDNPSKSYWPGQEVTGRVIVVCTSDKTVEGLKIKVEGKDAVKWTHLKQRGNNTTVHIYEDADLLLLYEYYAVSDGRTSAIIPAGRNEFPFSYSLPTGLPSSFAGKYGKVVYEIEVKMHRSWKFDQVVKAQFIVNAVVDLNLNPAAFASKELTDSKKLYCFCCTSGPLGYVLRIPKQGYVPGETAGFEVDMQNSSNSNVKSVIVSLIQVNQYFVRHHTKVETKTLARKKHLDVKAGTSATWTGDALPIPSVPPTGLGSCRIINVQFMIHIELDIAGLSSNLAGSVPIFVGTIPLRNNFSNILSQPSSSGFQFSAPPFAHYPDLPPPSYEDATRGDQPATEAEGGQNDYLPKYVNYGWRAE